MAATESGCRSFSRCQHDQLGAYRLQGICAALLSQLFYYHALKSGEPSIVVLIIAIFPLFTFIIATIFLGDKITLSKVGGILFIVLGVVLLRI